MGSAVRTLARCPTCGTSWPSADARPYMRRPRMSRTTAGVPAFAGEANEYDSQRTDASQRPQLGPSMNRPSFTGAMVAVAFALFVSASSGQDRPREITERDGCVIEVLGSEGRTRDAAPPPSGASSALLSRCARPGEGDARDLPGEDAGP